MFGDARSRRLTARSLARFVWRRVVRYGEPLEHRQLLSAGGIGGVAALPAAHASSPITSPIPYGDTPGQIRNAYGFNQVAFNNGTSTIAGDGSGQTIAIVDAYGDSKIASDVHAFDVQFGLADPNLKVVNQNGGTKLPGNNSGWALETALDVEWAHAIAPDAQLLLVEANNSSLGNLLAGVNYARNQPGVVAVSMSWGAGEFLGETSYDSYFTTPAGHQGVTFVAASGDSGAGTIWPGASPNVLSTGGTTLNIDSSGNYLGETAWTGSGGGLSLYESQPTYQSQSGLVTQSATQRAAPDVAYDADPASGVAVYDSISYAGQTGWFQVGGTSAAAPQMAALVAVADQGRQIANGGAANSLPNAQASLYSLAANPTSYSSDFHDTTSGSNGLAALDQAAAGFDLVTGLGTPKAAALVQGLVTAQATTVVSTASTSSRAGSSSPDALVTPTALVEILVIDLRPASSVPTVPILATPVSNLSTPAVSVALPSAAPEPFAVNSLLTDDPMAVPFMPAKRAPEPAAAPPDEMQAPTSHRDAVRDHVFGLIGEDSLFDDALTFLSREEAASACDACFADTALAETLFAVGDAAIGVNGHLPQAAGLVGLVVLAALVDRPQRVAPEERRRQTAAALPRR
ncbi:MAG TPA: S53 family peptidase [Pirellulales bacterium]|jgi:hypothetical protein|nr:S53 family peptidase [Pirellulales bacterium]